MILGIDLYECRRDWLASEGNVTYLLRELVALTSMTIIREPSVLSYSPPDAPDDWGVTGDVIIAESHIAIHTWPERGYAHVLVDSCRDFDDSAVKRFVAEQLGSQRAKAGVLDLGLYSAMRAGELAKG